MKLTRVLLVAASMFAAHLSWAVAKEVVIPGGAANAGQAISFTTLTGESVPADATKEDGDLVVTIYFEGDASEGTLTVGGRDFYIPGGNGTHRVPENFSPTRVPDITGLIPRGPTIKIGYTGGGDSEWGEYTSHAVELTGDGEFAIASSDDSVDTDGLSIGFEIPVAFGGIRADYEQWEGDDRYGRDIPSGTGQFAIVNDNFLNGDPNGSTGACCDSGINTVNELDYEAERVSLEFAWPCSWDAPGNGVFMPHVGITLGSLDVSQRSFDAFVTPGLETINTRSDLDFENKYYQLRAGGDYALPFNDRWGLQTRLGLALQYSDSSVDLRQDVTLFTPAGGTSVSDSVSETSLAAYGGVGLYVNATDRIRIDAGYYFDYHEAPDPTINQSGDDLFVDNRTSTVDLASAFDTRFSLTVRATLGGQ
ncbi:MAG: autotransporter domain-containing protein [Pseudomonadaceae bacterium]|nr:autotransporter domain-containing protein [Pseudomonadaceae bacterium]